MKSYNLYNESLLLTGKINECKCVFRVHIFSKCIICYFSYLIGLDVQLLEIQICCCKGNHTAHSQNLFFFCVLLNIHHIKNDLSKKL